MSSSNVACRTGTADGPRVCRVLYSVQYKHPQGYVYIYGGAVQYFLVNYGTVWHSGKSVSRRVAACRLKTVELWSDSTWTTLQATQKTPPDQPHSRPLPNANRHS